MNNEKIKIFSSKKSSWCGLKMTHSAAHQIKKLIKNEPNVLGLRLNVKKSGCAGFSYKIEKVINIDKNDQIYEYDGAKLYVPIEAMFFVDGTELDYVKEGLNHMFKFNNPKAKHACGCGESFAL
ncbi:Fe-S cluster assembly scaffold SufA [Sodalis sp. CWE]|uniref:Fe-S cluster assembly scaffold SufA n=1 Tax=Sodalis sp. CWE TaxID=2803816 RepID=UPI00351CE1D2